MLFPLCAKGTDIPCFLPKGASFEALLQEGRVLKPYFYRADHQNNIYMVSDYGVCLNIFDPKKTMYVFPKSFNMTDVFWVSSQDCLFSDRSSIYSRNIKTGSVLQLIQTSMHYIRFKVAPSGIYYFDKNGTELYFFSFSSADSKKLCQFAKPIVDICVAGNLCFVAYGETVGIISENNQYHHFFKINDALTSIEVGANGVLFYGTNSGLFYRDSKRGLLQPIIALGVDNLFLKGEDLYAVFVNGSSARFRGISAYKAINAKKQITEKFFGNLSSKGTNNRNARMALSQESIVQSLNIYAESVSHEQANRMVGAGVRGDLLAEFAYAFALNHDFEAALMNIDRARMVGTKYGDFYAAQVLTLMGYTDAAQQLMKQARVPEWINGVYQGLNEKYKMVGSANRPAVSINSDAPETALKRANKLAANRQTIQSMALFEELKALYDSTYIIYVDYSTLWESLGNYAYAAHLLQKGIDMMPQEQGERMQIFQNHLIKVNDKKARFENASWMKRLLGMNPPKLMTYVGASAAKDMYSLNGRMGLYTSNKFSASVNLGVNYASKEFSGSIGVSGYKAWGIFVGGLGITDMFGKKMNTLSLTPSVGLSFLNKNQTSSFDIMVNGYVPFSSEQKFSYSISVGKTIYFDLNGLLK